VILHQLNNDPDVIRVIFYGDDSHDVGSIFSIWILAVFVGQDKASISLMNLGSLSKEPH
jgi:hypothetical protein